jgi:hypothetical protein
MSKRSNSKAEKDMSVLLDELPEKILEVYFGELVDEHARLFANTGDQKTEKKFKDDTREQIERQFRDSLRTELQEYLTSESEEVEYDRKTMQLVLQQAQKSAPKKWIGQKKLQEDELWQEISGFWEIFGEYSGAYNNLLEIIAIAIQKTVITSPYWLKTPGSNVNFVPIEKALVNVVQKLFRVRLKYLVEEEAQGLFYENLFSLYHSIFNTDNALWIPLETPATAPLKGEALRDIYAREQGAPYRLAQQIVKGDGIILISGYRGVGKSTFLNAALNEFVPIAETNQYGGVYAKIMPVHINIAKASNINSALRLCIRGIYQATNEAPEGLILQEELDMISTANIRSTFQVNISQGEILSKAKEFKIAFGFNPSEISSKLSFANKLGMLPVLGHSYSKNLHQKIDQNIRLLDYDEDRAEEDIIELIKNLTRPRIFNGKETVVKPVFVFDELDKIPREEQDKLIRQLKNLFLSQNAVFILVTSKDFYYLLEEERRKEDSILGSYFSSVITVPIFSSRETEQLLRALMVEKIDFTQKLNEKDQSIADFISLIAKHLTYRAFGLPREIIRELRENLLWTRVGLQPYLTNQAYPIPMNAVRLFAEIQQTIENLDTQKLDSSALAESIPNDQSFLGERLWQQDEARNEQMRRGLYVLVEELIEQGTLVNTPEEKGIVTRVYQNNFKNIAREHFNSLFEELGNRLSQIIDGETGLACFESTSGAEAKISVLKTFDDIVQKQPRYDLDELPRLTPKDSLEEVKKWLNAAATDNVALRRVFFYLSLAVSELSLPRDLQVKLFELFVIPIEASDKLNLLSYITSDALCWILRNSTEDSYLAWLDFSQDKQVLNAFLKKLLAEETAGDCPAEPTLNILFKLLTHPEKTPALTTSIIDGLVKTLKNTIVKPEYIELIFDSLDKSVDLNDVSRNDLFLLAKSADIDLISLLIKKDFVGVSMDTLSWLLRQTDYHLEKLWTTLDRTKPLSQRLLATIIWQYRDKPKELPVYISDWLNSNKWSEQDTVILDELRNKDLRLLFTIQEQFDRRRKTLLNSFMATAKKGAASSSSSSTSTGTAKVKKPTTTSSSAAKKKKSRSGWFSALWVLISFVVLYWLPVDTPQAADFTLGLRLWTRTLELIYMVSFVIALFMFFGSSKGWSLIPVGVGIGSIALLVYTYSIPLTFGGQIVVLLVSAQAIIVGLIAIGSIE